jgi:hypothetical protein
MDAVKRPSGFEYQATFDRFHLVIASDLEDIASVVL